MAVVLLGYMLGAIPFGLVVGWLAGGVDVRQYGSGKTGFANVLRTLGTRAGVVVFIADVAKGALAVVLAGFIVGCEAASLGAVALDIEGAQAMAALAAAIGHNWSVYIKFEGGRGVDTSLGGLLVMAPYAGLACIGIGALVIGLTRYVSLGSILGAATAVVIMAPLFALGHEPVEFLVYAVAAALLIVFQHRDNIRRLLAGTEPQLGQGGDRR